MQCEECNSLLSGWKPKNWKPKNTIRNCHVCEYIDEKKSSEEQTYCGRLEKFIKGNGIRVDCSTFAFGGEEIAAKAAAYDIAISRLRELAKAAREESRIETEVLHNHLHAQMELDYAEAYEQAARVLESAYTEKRCESCFSAAKVK
jgi:hypothetical protein